MTPKPQQEVSTPLSQSDLKSKTFFSIFWSVVRAAWSTLASFIIFVFLARLLQPSDFGLFALASLFFEVGRIVTNGGLADAVMRQQTLDEELADTAFWASIALSTVIAIAIFAAAPLYESMTNMTGVSELLRWLCLLMPVAALGGIHTARIARNFSHQSLAKQSFVVTTVAGGSAILGAYQGLGAHSLLLQAVVTNVLATALSWHFFRWKPRLRFDVPRLRAVAHFSTGMMATQLLWILMARVQDIFISRAYGAVEVGRYRVAWRMIELIGQAVVAPIGSVALITLSKLQHDPVRFAAAYRKFIGGAALAGLPLLLGFGVIADEVITYVFGSQWAGTAVVAEILVLIAVPFVLNYISVPALAAINKSGAILAVSSLQVVLTVAFTYFATPYGMLAIAGAYVARAYLMAPVQQAALRLGNGVPTTSTLSALSLPLALSLVMASAIWLAKPLIASLVGTGLVFLTCIAAIGVSVYGFGLLIFGKDQIAPYLEPLLAVIHR